jgi:HAD superfamily hydrolase (TIGR01509 family)
MLRGVIPWGEIDAVFLDAGNTLVSIDFDRVATELAALGHACAPEALRRAEAAARPAVSRFVAARRSTESEDSFLFYVRAVLGEVPGVAAGGPAAVANAADALAPRLRFPGESWRLWRQVLPGVPEALASLRELGLPLVVVSNSDGSIERGLAETGLRGYFSAVVDSARVGVEKPDPRIFEHAVRHVGVSHDRALHVGDLYDADVAGARAAGVHAVLLDPFDDWGDVDCERAPDLGAVAQHLGAARRARP